MSSSIAEAVRQLVHHKGISEDLIMQTVEDVLLAAYKKKFGNSDNAVTKINEESGEVFLYSKKEVVDEVDESLTQISLEEARQRNSQCELNDEVLVEIKPTELGRIAAQTAKQIVFQRLREIERNLIYSEYSQKIGELITGHYQRERNGHIFVDLGRTEAILPRHEQSPKEIFTTGERIKGVIVDVQNNKRGTSIIMSRAAPAFVQRLFELDVPEITDGTIQVKSIVRDAGYRTKLAVYAHDIDPVGACVGMKGMRIQTIVKELEGEKIDIIRYNENIREYIANALSPAKADQVVIVNEENRESLAVVQDDQLSLAIGKQGQNVKLASKLTGWSIDIKTLSEFKELDFADESRRMAEDLFSDHDEDEGHSITELTDLDENIIKLLLSADVTTLEELVEQSEETLKSIEGMDEGMVTAIMTSIKENVVVVDDEGEEAVEEKVSGQDMPKEQVDKKEDLKDSPEKVEDEETLEEEEVTYFCPECNAELEIGVNNCPKCGVELEFEE